MNKFFHSNRLAYRACAALMLALWMVGFVVCQTECLAVSKHCQDSPQHKDSSKQATSSGKGESHTSMPCHSPEKDSGSEGESNCCCSVQLVIPNEKGPEFDIAPLLMVGDILDHEQFSNSVIELEAQSLFDLESWREWTLTPELYLGPGIHSLAPPLLHS